MSTRTASRLLLAALAAGSLLLAGCEPATDQQGGTSLSGGCDPHGFGPFSGCGNKGGSSDQTAEPVAQSGTCDPHGFGPLSGCGSDTQQDATSGGGPLPQSYYWRARHEAGHENCAEDLGMSVASVWLHPDGEGRTNVFGFRLKDPQQRLVVLYCGAAAAGTEKGTRGKSSDGQPGDYDQADEILAEHPDDTDGTKARAEADRIVAKRSAQIDRDAAQLLRDGSLG